MILDNNSSAPSQSTVKKIDGEIKKSYNQVLKGISASTWNGGICQPVAFKKIYAGTKIKNYNISGQLRSLTPLVPLTTKLTTTFKAFFVPNSRVWTNAEKFSAQKSTSGGYTKQEPYVTANAITGTGNSALTLTDYIEWRDCIASGYYPRILTGTTGTFLTIGGQMSGLPLRGYVAIYNDYLRHKELDPEITEFKTDNISSEELKKYRPTRTGGALNDACLKRRGKKRDNYYTNYRTSLVGQTTTKYPDGEVFEGQTLENHIEWQKTIAEMRENAENAQLNDWEIIAKLRGSRVANQGKVQLIGEKSVGHNYSQVAQTVYNEATPNPEFQSLGTTGAYSFTEFSIDIINYEEIIEDGYIHIIAQTSADTIFAGGIDRELMNIQWDTWYRPELADLKDDQLLSLEISTQMNDFGYPTKGFKRKYSELFKLPTHIAGDLTEGGFKSLMSEDIVPSESFWLCQETSLYAKDIDANDIFMKSWRDNSDILINNTMALKQQIKMAQEIDYKILGKNQIKMIAQCQMIADLPFDERIRNDFKAQTEV